MKVNMVTGKPGNGGPARCLLISEEADQALDFFTELRNNKGVLADTGEKFVGIALFQRPLTTKRSTFQENVEVGSQNPKKVENAKAVKKSRSASTGSSEKDEGAAAEETGI